MTITLSATEADVRAEHKTQKYRTTTALLVRRGFPINLQTSATSLTLRLVSPRTNANLSYSLTVSTHTPSDGWSLKSNGSQATLTSPTNAIVGFYTVSDSDNAIQIAVLFNPFAHSDPVYMSASADRDEYVLNDAGRMWVGSSNSLSGIPWSFSQFREISWKAALSFLDPLPVETRRDHIKVTRHLSAAVNSQDDNGVLAGRWDGNYSNGTSPSAWTGSFAILEQYWNTRRPVRYGQCWVFSGVLTTVLRALGIPSRSVTNFLSAHDTTKPYNRAVDMYFDSDGDAIERMSADSIWNFHVWNTAWMTRPDLSAESSRHGLDFNGWQVLDATPQEESSGLYQLGPASLTAIKHGYNLKYDVDFVIGETNADVLHHWQVEGTNEFVVRRKFTRHVGQKISTKAVGRDQRNDVTLYYKFPEGSKEEREALARRPSNHIEPPAEPSEDVKFSIESYPVVKVGETVRFIIRAKNTGDETATVRLNCLYRGTDYTGTPRARIGNKKEHVTVQPNQTGELVIEVSAEQYEPLLANGTQTIQFRCSGKVKETGQVWSEVSLVRMSADDALMITAPKSVKIGESVSAKATIKNIAHVPLTNVKLRAEGEGLTDLVVTDLETIQPGATVESKIPLKPSDVGDKLLVTTLDTDELKDISRSVHITVEAAAPSGTGAAAGTGAESGTGAVSGTGTGTEGAAASGSTPGGPAERISRCCTMS